MATVGVRTTPKEREIIPNHYVVIFKEGTSSEKRAEHRAWAAEKHFNALSVRGHTHGTVGIRHKFNLCDGLVAGYCASFDEDTMKEVDACDEVHIVEPDYKVYATKKVTLTDVPSWGLARIVHQDKLTLETQQTYAYDDEAAGAGTWAYIIDTGILADHVDFEGRATFGHNAVPGSSNTDKNGHGTHVSGTIGGKKYGVAKKANLIGIKVLGDNGSGSNSSVIAGINWAVADAQQKGIHNCVANMSLGGPYSKALNMVVEAAVKKGLTMVVAAGNNGEDAREQSPASEKTAITVGATSIDDTVPWWSNWGPLVDISAPGDKITSSWIDAESGNANDKSKSISGTSMASPHVCGVAAYLISKYRKTATPLDTPGKVLDKLRELSIKGKIGDGLQGGTINLLVNTGESVQKA